MGLEWDDEEKVEYRWWVSEVNREKAPWGAVDPGVLWETCADQAEKSKIRIEWRYA